MMSKRNLWAALGLTIGAAALYLAVDPLDRASADAQESDSTTDASDEASTDQNTSEVVVETLSSSSEFNGNLSFGETRQLTTSADGVITWLPEDEVIIESGDVLWEINQQPVPYLEGSIPMYRDLYSGVKKGDDVLQLETYLISQGFGPENWVADTTFNRTTRNAVKELEKFYGMTVDGTLTPAEVMFGTEPIRVADTAYVGDGASAGPILTVTDAEAKVEVSSSARQLTVFQASPEVLIVLSDGRELAASLDETKATPADETGQFGYTVKYVVADAVGEAQPVKVKIEKVLAEDALTVPVDALIALSEGGYAVEVIGENDRAVLRAVEVVDFDDTRVAITGNVVAGDLVVVP